MMSLQDDFNFGNGYNWLVRDVPQLIEEDIDTTLVLQGTQGALWFDLVAGEYRGLYGSKFTFTHDESAGLFHLAAPNGQVLVFNDFDSANAGLFKSRTTAGGQVLEVASYAPGTLFGIGEIQRTVAPTLLAENRPPNRFSTPTSATTSPASCCGAGWAAALGGISARRYRNASVFI